MEYFVSWSKICTKSGQFCRWLETEKNNNLKAIFLNAWFVVFLHGFHEHLHVHNIPFYTRTKDLRA